MPDYEQFWVAVDPVIFTIQDNQLKVLLAKREKEPFQGKYELLGGLLRKGETAEQTLQRKLKDVLGVSKTFFTQFYTFTDPKRDPRERAVSIGFLALVNAQEIRSAHTWFSIKNTPSLAFDHKIIIQKANDYLKENLNSGTVRHFLPEKFPLNKLQAVHEVILQQELDNRNFRKKMMDSGVVKETEEMEQGVSHRPAKLYQFKA